MLKIDRPLSACSRRWANRRLMNSAGRWIRPLVLGSVLIGGAWSAAHGENRAVSQWFNDVFVAGFINGDPDFYRHYADTVHFVAGGKQRTLSREKLAELVDQDFVRSWTEAGWTTTRIHSIRVQGLGSTGARVTALWELLDDTGKSVVDCPYSVWHYILVATDGDWQVVTEIEGDCPS